ncbi:MAG: acetolactate synthase [Lachnospiraceae bacterium]|nr:acetolactate synthase [Lachnospiraceae bacterium]
MSVKQISVFLENRPGTLERMTGALSAAGVDMRALSLAETKDFGIARMVVDDAMSAVNVLKDADFVASLTSVLVVEIPDEVGGLNKLLAHFTETGVNIEYMYAFLGGSSSNASYMIFRVADTDAAEAKLAKRGLKLLSQEDIAGI